MSSKGKTNKQKESIETKYKLGEMIGEGGNAKVFAVIPVSYTHLDVYKRQGEDLRAGTVGGGKRMRHATAPIRISGDKADP